MVGYVKKTIAIFLTVLFLMGSAGCSLMQDQPAAPKTALCVNEVVSSNKQSLLDPDVGSPDWIELYNPTDRSIDLAGYGLSDNTNDFHKFVFSEGSSIPAGGYLIVYCGDNNGINATTVPCTGFGLSKSGDNLYLTDPYYNLLSNITVPALVTDVSYAQKSDGTFGYCAEPTPGAPNDDSKIFSSIDNILTEKDYSGLTVSEVMPSAANGGPWIELYNRSSLPIQLDNYYLSDSPTNLLRFQLPESTIQSGSYAIVYADGVNNGERELETSFKLSKNDTSVYLTSIDGRLVETVTWEKDIPTGLSAVFSDGTARYTAFPTPGAANSDRLVENASGSPMDSTDPVRINEVLQKNKYSITDAEGIRWEWVELYNSSGADVSLKNCFLSDSSDDLFKFALPDVSIGPRSYLVIFLSGKDITDGQEIHASFKLGKSDTFIYLTDLSTMRTDSLPLMQDPPDNVSIGRDKDGNPEYYAQPTPWADNAQGFENADLIGFFNNQGVFISEVSTVKKAKTDTPDWIELFNGSGTDIDLSGWHLTDNADRPDRYTFSEGTVIPAQTYITFDMSDDEPTAKMIPFSLASSGEEIVLSDAQGVVIDRLLSGYIRPGYSVGRIESDIFTDRVYFQKPTKGKANTSETLSGYAADPVFSVTSLYHTEPFDVTISCPDSTAEIRYTTDGSAPTKKSKLYSGPISVSRNTVLRAAAYSDARMDSNTVTCTYLFDDAHTVPVVSVSIDPDLLRDVNHASKTDKPERVAYVSYYTENGLLGVNFPAGLKAKGQGTVGYVPKSYSLSLRGGYGQGSVTYPFFSDCAVSTFYSLVLRNGGQDITMARMRDSFCSRIVNGLNLDYACTRPVALYLNGEYWGLYDLNEELNADYLVSHFGVKKSDVDFVKRNEWALKGSAKGYLNARSFARNERLKSDSVFEEFAKMVDVDYCTDYIIAQTFIINSDMFNQKFWHTKDETVRWRPVFFDLDFGFQEASSAKRNLLPAYFSAEGIPSHDGSLTNLDVFVGLKKNEAWKTKFIERYVELLCTKFSEEELLKVFDGMVEEMRPEMERHIARWRSHGMSVKSVSDWNEHLDLMRRRVAARPAGALENLQKYFHLSDSYIRDLVQKYSN